MSVFRRARIGHSLIELLIAVAIIAIVMSMLLVVIRKVYRVVDSFRGPATLPTTTQTS
jgi:prepilin-type N-terminal cleavage/methylation domain-containing protein